MSPRRAVAPTTGTNISLDRSRSRSGSEPGCMKTVPITRNGGSSSATSYSTLCTLNAIRSVSFIGGSESSPAVTRIRSYGSTLRSPGAGSSGAEPSVGPQVTSEIAIASRLLSASVRRPAIIILPRRRQSSVIAMNGTPRTLPAWRLAESTTPAVGETPPDRVMPAGSAVAPPAPPAGAAAPAGAALPADEPGASAGLRRFRNPNGTGSVLRLAAVVADRLDHRLVGQRRRVAQRPALRDVAQQPAHDLAAPRLRQVGHEHEEFRPRDRADHVRHVLPQLDAERVAGLLSGLEDHEREDRLAADRVVLADDGGLRHGSVIDERGLDLRGGDPVTGDVHHVVHPAEQPQVAVLVALRAVAGEVLAREP